MRTIKYRYWNGTDKKMYYKDTWDNFPIAGKNECFLQFTGLLDKFGKEIYEKDIVNWLGCGKPTRVVWSNLEAQWNVVGDGGGTRLSNIPSNMIEVIGNIYEHPELLKSK